MEFETEDQERDTIFSLQAKDKTELRIIFLTDYHMKEMWVDQLRKWYETTQTPLIDLVILGGDFDNLSVYSMDPDHPEYKISEARISAFFSSLSFL